MMQDPYDHPDGRLPYDVLECVGVTPESTHAQVLEASFELLGRGLMTPETNAALDELRLLQRRILIDFFLYDVDSSTELADAADSLATALRAVEDADLAQLRRIDPAVLQDLTGPQDTAATIAEADWPAIHDPPVPEGIFLFEFDR